MLNLSFPDQRKEALYQIFCDKQNTKIYHAFVVYLLVPMVYLSAKGLYLNGEVALIVKESIAVILILYFLNQITNSKKPKDIETKEELENDGENYTFHNFNKNLSQIFFCGSIIFLYVVQVWIINPPNLSKYSSNYWFYSGSSLESVRAFLYSSRVRWQNIMGTAIFLNLLLLVNFCRLNENSEVTYFQIIFPFITSNVLPCFFFLHEKNLRKIFEDNIDNQNKLKYYEILINRILPDQVIILCEQDLVYCNEAAKKFNGSNNYQEISKRLKTDYLEQGNYQDMISYIEIMKIYANDSFYSFQAKRIDVITNETFFFEVKIQKINWQGKKSLLILLHDISAIKNLEKMKEMDVYKDQLLANVSHDLRTPLYGIIGSLEMILQKPISKEIRSELKMAMKCSNLLIYMINDILDYSQINQGKLSLSFSKTSVQEIVDEVYSMVKFQAKKKGLQLIMNLPETIKNFSFTTDPRRLQQILLNLLSNAIKFTFKGQVTFSVTLHANHLFFAVKDTGIGISKHAQKRLFNFYAKLNSTSLNKEGIGLGLVICKKILHFISDSDIKVESSEGVGSKFEFYLTVERNNWEISQPPAQIQAQIQPQSQPQTQSQPQPQMEVSDGRWKVLVVEDDQICLYVICKYLESFGLLYKTAGNGVECLEILQKERFSLVIMDCHMPVMGGFETTKNIRQMQDKHEIPNFPIIIATAGSSQQIELEELYKKRIDRCLIKPVTRKLMKITIEGILGIQISEQN